MTNKWKDGLPPVGEECLVRHKVASKDLCKAVINFIGNKTFNATWSSCGTEFCNEIAAFDFRPLKTVDEIERDRLVELAFKTLTIDNSDLAYKICQDLYDAGLLHDKKMKPTSFKSFKEDYDSRGGYIDGALSLYQLLATREQIIRENND